MMKYEDTLEIVHKLPSTKQEQTKHIEEWISKSYVSRLLKNIEFYQKHPMLCPFIGKEFDTHKKIMLIGESHYLPKQSTCFLTKGMDSIAKWYQYDVSWKQLHKEAYGFSREDIAYMWTIHVLYQYLCGNHAKGTERMFGTPWKAMKHCTSVRREFLLEKSVDTHEIAKHIAFMNYFIRPESTYGSFLHTIAMDEDMAYENLKRVIKELQPDHIFFLSNLAGKSFVKRAYHDNDLPIRNMEEDCTFLHHPSTPCSWNRCLNKFALSREDLQCIYEEELSNTKAFCIRDRGKAKQAERYQASSEEFFIYRLHQLLNRI